MSMAMPKLPELMEYATLAVIAALSAFAQVPGSSAAAPDTPAGNPLRQFAYTNQLVNSNDPYLLLHAHNPVDWYP